MSAAHLSEMGMFVCKHCFRLMSEEENIDPSQECCRRSFSASLKDSANQVLKNPKLAKLSERERRLNICQTCDYYQEKTGICSFCGCILAIKASFETMECPIGKWHLDPEELTTEPQKDGEPTFTEDMSPAIVEKQQTNNMYSLTSDYGYISLGNLFYLGWRNQALPGDEQFGISIGNFYLGVYDNQWCRGLLDGNGALIEN